MLNKNFKPAARLLSTITVIILVPSMLVFAGGGKKLQKQLEECESRVTTLETENADLEKQNEYLKQQITKFLQEKNNLLMEVASLRAKVAEKEKEIQLLEEEAPEPEVVAKVEERIKEKESQIQELQMKREELQKEKNALEQENVRLRQNLENVRDQLASLRREHNNLQNRYNSLEGQVQNLRSQNQDLQSDVSQLRSQNQDLQTKNEQLENKIEQTSSEKQQLQEQLAKYEQIKQQSEKLASMAYQQLRDILKDEIEAGKVRVFTGPYGIVIDVLGEYVFDVGKVNINSGGKSVLKKIATLLDEEELKDYFIGVIGNADSQPIVTPSIKERFPTNWELSAHRGAVVVRYMLDNSNLSPDKVLSVGAGIYQPIDDNTTVSGRGNNRRIDIVVLPADVLSMVLAGVRVR